MGEFSKNKGKPLDLQLQCKLCNKDYRMGHKKDAKIYGKIYRKINKDKLRIQGKNHYKLNKNKIKVRSKDYRERKKEQIKIAKKIYYKANKEKINIYMKAYRKSNKEKLRIKYNIWRNQKRKTDFKLKLNENISKAIRKSLKDGKNGRHWEDIVGYTIDKLKKHLEKQFADGMNWDNYGFYGWQIDHKIPISAFNFIKSDHRDFKRCWALSNLQPLWATENKKKLNKINKHFQPSLLI